MGLFSKKEKPKCPICGNEMGFFSSTEVKDGKICDSCYKRFTPADNYEKLDIAFYKEQFDKDAKQFAELQEKFGNFSAAMKIEEMEILNLKATDVGIKNAKNLNGSTALRGTVIFGEFVKGCKIFGVHAGEKVELNLIDLYKDKGSMTDAIAGSIGRNSKVGEYANCIVDFPQGMDFGDVIIAE